VVNFYTRALRPVLFALDADPEWLHSRSVDLLDRLQRGAFPAAKQIVAQLERTCCYEDEVLGQTLWGLRFPNPFGLAAGFDKDGLAAGLWAAFGFGYAELGTVTQHPQPGNPQPRLFRLPRDRAVLNRMGFNNRGSAALAERLRTYRASVAIPLGINLGKSKLTPLEAAASDYAVSFRRLRDLGDYFVVNVSSPNTPGLRSLQESDHLRRILDALQAENPSAKPLLVKIAPDLEDSAILDVLALAREYQLAGLIATNTTIARDNLRTKTLRRTGTAVSEEAGGISGQPLRDRATDVIRLLYRESGGEMPIIGVGGIFTAEDAWEKIAAGASLVQVYTGWIYEGPLQAKRVASGLAQRVRVRGMTSIVEAVGSALR